MLWRYNDTIQEQIQMGIVEDVPLDIRPSTYNPHHAVICTDKSMTKLWIVYDASANKFNQKLLNILLRFWAHHVAVTANIEKAFFDGLSRRE